jgi:hypothetical protein
LTGPQSGRRTLFVPALFATLVPGCLEGEELLPECDEGELRRRTHAGDQSEFPDGLYEVLLSQPTRLEIARGDDILKLSFPASGGAVLPATGSDVDLVFRSGDAFYATLKDPSNEALLLELGDTETFGGGASRSMAFHDLGLEDSCRSGRAIRIARAAIRFETDDGAVILGPGEEMTSSIDGDPVILRAFVAARFEWDDGVLDHRPFTTDGIILPLAP